MVTHQNIEIGFTLTFAGG